MAEKKDATLESLKDKVKKAEKRLKNASDSTQYAPYGVPTEKQSAEAELKKAKEELQRYQVKTGTTTVDTSYFAEDYPGQLDVEKKLNENRTGTWIAEDGSTIVANREDIGGTTAGTQQYLYIGREGFGPSVTTRPYESGAYSSNFEIKNTFNDIRQKILEDYQKSGPDGLANLFDKMYRAGYIKKETADAKRTDSTDFNSGLKSLVVSYSKDLINDHTFNKSKEPVTFDAWLSTTKKSGTAQSYYNSVTTLKQDAVKDIDRFFVEFLGRGATTAEEDEYFKALRDLEKKNVVKTTTTDGGRNETGRLVTQEDVLRLQRQIAGKALDGSDLDTVLKTGSKSARSITGLMGYARQYGLQLSTKDAANYLSGSLSGGNFDEDAIKAKIVNISKASYSNLTELSDQVSLRDLSINLVRTMGNVLELDPNGIDVMDPTIQKALKNNGNKGIMNTNDFEIMLRNDPRWGKTKNAKEEASKYAYEILNSFGLMA